ncbi:hypothetical protein DPMN_018018 [Dreissena polymorpha]|uniref:Uncharacterized protein n=1 Tax=Dreissena polymorpha TaxID=45954 RepID=A0A9D4S6X5_DREPO|nr:hypothetical protein DPMN_018018 [Dreissena polymorpha]
MSRYHKWYECPTRSCIFASLHRAVLPVLRLQVVDLYNELLWLIDLAHFPEDYEPPSSYSMLVSTSGTILSFIT